MELVEWKEAKRKAYAAQASRLDLKNVTKKNMEKVKLPKLVKETWWPTKRKSGKGPGFYQNYKSKQRRGVAANKAEENSTQNINKENETKEERETSSSKQSSKYLKNVNLNEFGNESESESTENLKKSVQQCSHQQADINLEIEDVNLLFVKFTYDYFKNANNDLRTK